MTTPTTPLDATTSTLRKTAGEPMEAHQATLAGMDTLFDVHAYVDDFNSTVVDAYRRNVGDGELPADRSVARSIVPPGTAASRDFSGLAPLIPDLIREACVGCMTCVNACPDTAILGIALPKTQVEARTTEFVALEPRPDEARDTIRGHFAHTQKYAEVPARKGLEPAEFGIFVDPLHCKGCSECVDGLPRARLRRAPDDRQDPRSSPAVSGRSSAWSATSGSSGRFPSHPRSTGTSGRWPT